MSTDAKMSTAQRLVYDAIKKYTDEHGYSPALDDIARALGRPNSRGGIQAIVERLVRKGFVARAHGVPRSLRVISEADRAQRAQTTILDRIANDFSSLSPEAQKELAARLQTG